MDKKQARPSLTLLPQRFAICRLPPSAALPDWVAIDGLLAVTHTDEELSIVCAQTLVPDSVQAQRDWACLKVQGPLDLTQTGILAALTAKLAQAAIPVFAISTYDTDYLLVPACHVERAHALLR